MAGDTTTDRARYRTFKNTVWGLVACLAFAAAIGALAWRPYTERVRAIDYSAELTQARQAAPYRVLAPTPMPAGWQATSARVDAREGNPVTWHLGIVTADRAYVGLEQSPASAEAFVANRLGPTRDDGTSTVAGMTWQRKALTEKDERAIVRSGDGVTTIVTGTTDYATLERFAATLR